MEYYFTSHQYMLFPCSVVIHVFHLHSPLSGSRTCSGGSTSSKPPRQMINAPAFSIIQLRTFTNTSME